MMAPVLAFCKTATPTAAAVRPHRLVAGDDVRQSGHRSSRWGRGLVDRRVGRRRHRRAGGVRCDGRYRIDGGRTSRRAGYMTLASPRSMFVGQVIATAMGYVLDRAVRVLALLQGLPRHRHAGIGVPVAECAGVPQARNMA
ncbi:hypothetical protein ABZP36_002759 [Zizania latifolia]